MKNLILMILLIVVFTACNETNEPEIENEFSIYLLKDTTNNSPYEVSISNLILEKEPVISLGNVISYTWNSHKIEYSDEAKKNIKSKTSLYGKYFVVSASNQRMYWGTFVSQVYSGICDNPAIILPPTSLINNNIAINRAYPKDIVDESWPDVRTNKIINDVLKKNGKLN